ncbi:MAG TPA: hypothetical protein VN289_05110, partial [Paraburkholderia sp.]|nr:hypothetical protein [Paraburkholderia sp.]
MTFVTSPQPLKPSQAIRDYQNAIDASREWFRNPNNEQSERGATPGAFLGNPSGPAGYARSAYEIYNNWVAEMLKQLRNLRDDGTLTETIDASQASFDAWHRDLVNSLDDYWREHAHPDFPLTRRQLHKLVDLAVKWLRIKVPSETRDAIEQRGHTTLSGPTMERLGPLLGEEPFDFPPNDQFDDWYAVTQQRIRDFCN